MFYYTGGKGVCQRGMESAPQEDLGGGETALVYGVV